MNTMVSNLENTSKPISAPQLTGVLKAIAPRSFEKTFDGIATEQIAAAIRICIDGLSRDQVSYGLEQVRDNGFCPDPAMFRKWCLGITGFGTEQQRLKDAFKGKHAALANIIRWQGDDASRITNAEKEAYNRCYEMFNAIKWAKNIERSTFLAYEAFKDNYTDIICEFAEQGIEQALWEPVGKIKSAVADIYKPVHRSWSIEQSPEDKAWLELRVEELRVGGLSYAKAMYEAMSERRDQRAGGAA